MSVAALAIAIPAVRAADADIDLDGNPANGAESSVETNVLQTFPVKIENVIFNNTNMPFTFSWPGAGPGGFESFVVAGPDVGTKWEWTTVSQVFSIQSPVDFDEDDDDPRGIPVFGQPPGGIGAPGGTIGFDVPGKSIFPTEVTVSSASLTSSLVTFFGGGGGAGGGAGSAGGAANPEQTLASCSSVFTPGAFQQTITNNSDQDLVLNVEQEDCCTELEQIICNGQCFSYQTDDDNCGGCGIQCTASETCSEGTCVPVCPPDEVLSFEGLPAGTLTTAIQSAVGPIGTFAQLASDPGVNRAAIFDSSNPTGGDIDLGSPNEQCPVPGPGRGNAGVPGEPTENCLPLGNLLIIAENLVDANGDGLIDSPDDAQELGAILELDFSAVAGATMLSVTLLDIEADTEPNGLIQMYDAAGALIASILEPGTGNNGKRLVDLQQIPGVYRIRFTFNGSGAIDDLAFVANQPQCPEEAFVEDDVVAQAAPAPERTFVMPKRAERQRTVEPAVDRTTRLRRQAPVRPTGRIKRDAIDAALPPAPPPEVQGEPAVEEAPLCDVNPVQTVLAPGESFTECQSGPLIGREVFTRATVQLGNQIVGEGPCALIVPDFESSVLPFTPTVTGITILDESRDGLCQPGEAWCEIVPQVANLGPEPLPESTAVITSEPDAFNPQPVVFLGETSSFQPFVAFDQQADCENTPVLTSVPADVGFRFMIPEDHEPDVGRVFNLRFTSGKMVTDMPFVVGLGRACDPLEDLDGETFDRIKGLGPPLNVDLAPVGNPVPFSSTVLGLTGTIPLGLKLFCGTMLLGGANLDPFPEIVSVERVGFGPISLDGLNAGPDPNDPFFACDDDGCEFLLRASAMVSGDYILTIRMPDTRVYRAGFSLGQ